MEVGIWDPVGDSEEKNSPFHWEVKLSLALEALDQPCM